MQAANAIAFCVALIVFLGIAGYDLRHHRTLDGTAARVTFGEAALHVLGGGIVTTILSLLLCAPLRRLVPYSAVLLDLLPIALLAIGLIDELTCHRVRCAADPRENWHHALLHFSLGSALLLGYIGWR